MDWVKSTPLVSSRKSCFGLHERMLADGEVFRPLDVEEVEALCEEIRAQGFEAVALCLLFAFLNPVHEQAVGAVFEEKLGDLPFSISHEVAPTWGEYERASTAIADAYIKPLVGNYVSELDKGLKGTGADVPWTMMKINGGVVEASAGAKNPIQMAMSGPAGGMIASQAIAKSLNQANVVTLDMGAPAAIWGLLSMGESG